MKKNPVYIIAILFSIFTSCQKELPYDMNTKTTQLILNSLLVANQEENKVFLYLTTKDGIIPVTNGVINIYINNELKESIYQSIIDKSENENDIHASYIIKSIFKEGDIIRIDAITMDGKYHAWGEVIVPKIPDVQSIDTVNYQLYNEYTNSFIPHIRFKINIKDYPDETNYFRIGLSNITTFTMIDNKTGKNTIRTIHTNDMDINEDIILTDGHPKIPGSDGNPIFPTIENKYRIFDDGYFANSSYTMSVSTSNQADYFIQNEDFKIEHTTVESTITLNSISKSEFQYLKALNILDSDAYNDILYEPIRLPSNINGGIGVLGISVAYSHKFTIYDQ